MNESKKDTIYIDVDDEITSVIDKVTSSKNKVVALVLPKRASVFQSIVNMKLLKKRADAAKKNIVLITTESGLLPLAGATGIYVAKTLSSKPEIPTPPMKGFEVVDNSEDQPINLDNGPKNTPKSDLEKSIGELDEEAQGKSELDQAVDDISASELSEDKNFEQSKRGKKSEKNKKVPNFDRFKKYALFGGIGLVALVFLGWILLSLLPSATITIQTNAQNINTNINFKLSTSATSLNQATKTVPAKQVTSNKNYSSTVNATGQNNYGLKASGTVTLSEKICGNITDPVPLPSGSGISQNGLTYITQGADTTFDKKNANVDGGCITFKATKDTSITAQNGGTKYNTDNSSFSVVGNSKITGNGSASGGTDNIVTVVSQADITNATNKLNQNNNQAKTDLSNQLQQLNYYPISATFTASNFNPTPSVAVGTQASSVTVTANVNYSMYGVRQDDLNTLLTTDIKSQAGSQSIIDTGLSNATFTTPNGASDVTKLNMQTTAEVGPIINVNQLKSQVAGQKAGTITSIIESNPNVTKVNVKFSPFYVSSAPSNQSKITIIVAKPTQAAK